MQFEMIPVDFLTTVSQFLWKINSLKKNALRNLSWIFQEDSSILFSYKFTPIFILFFYSQVLHSHWYKDYQELSYLHTPQLFGIFN